jgi:ubiquinone/menaquinone biosynthesis C-methylase UbiE
MRKFIKIINFELSSMNIYNFTNKGQGELYDAARPAYTNEMFSYVLDFHKGKKENFLDIACGTGQV